MHQVIRFRPIYQERVWGGRVLETALDRTLPPGGLIGESWEIVDRPEAQSVVNGGALDGQTLRHMIHYFGGDLMGPTWPSTRPFPILVKWLDCSERLSLQVHPPAVVAAKLKGEPKTENWFIAEAKAGANLIVGLKPGVTRLQFEQAIKDNTLEACVNRFPVNSGDSILVRSGQIHAIDAGNLILEIQQNSDTTYRVYDWGRVGLDGKPRQMHLAESLESIVWDEATPKPVRAAASTAVIADSREFRIRRVPLKAGETWQVTSGEQVRILSVVSGCVSFDEGRGQLKRGENVVIPYAVDGIFRANEAAVLLITENFT